MPHITLPKDRPGISGLMDAHPETERQLNALADALLRGPSSLSPAEREVIATFVSHRNACRFCTECHAAAARQLLGPEQASLMDDVLAHEFEASMGERLRALLIIAAQVREDGRLVSNDQVAAARAAGADDKAIHDTVLIAAAFCMYNRYVDGLATWTPTDPAIYERIGASLARNGYRRS